MHGLDWTSLARYILCKSNRPAFFVSHQDQSTQDLRIHKKCLDHISAHPIYFNFDLLNYMVTFSDTHHSPHIHHLFLTTQPGRAWPGTALKSHRERMWLRFWHRQFLQHHFHNVRKEASLIPCFPNFSSIPYHNDFCATPFFLVSCDAGPGFRPGFFVS